ncbi:MAG: hypothetical protein A3H39_18005 [candidate division NC10 bacterium RIFCSPLOWO2_02_FULL_66_22]|nr:MAG: hypothetical protein A3H39_18005 [candidate division NC10 bacterium RIFCSPLOWO2_02_FULL_66_22]
MAATLDAPIAGAIFALVFLAAVSSSVISRAVLGNFPSFGIPSYDLISERKSLFYAGLGALAAGGATAFVRILYALWRTASPAGNVQRL